MIVFIGKTKMEFGAKKETAVLFLITGLLTQFMSNTAAAALLCPIGLSIAESLGASPTAVVLAIGFSASAAYMTPVATRALPTEHHGIWPGGLEVRELRFLLSLAGTKPLTTSQKDVIM